MGWARLDDGWHDHPKTVAVGIDGAGLWAMCLTWAYGQRHKSPTPGVVPDGVIARFAGSPAKAKRLTEKLHAVGFLDARTDAGWPIHDFKEYLPKYDLELNRENGRKGGRPKTKPVTETVSEPDAETVSGSEPNAKRFETEPSRDRASARRNPIPIPKETVPPSAGGEAAGTVGDALEIWPGIVAASDTDPDSVGGLIGEWIRDCIDRPPPSIVSRIGKQVKELHTGGTNPAHIRGGLALWRAKGADPTALPSFVNQAMNAGPVVSRHQQETEGRFDRALARANAKDATA